MRKTVLGALVAGVAVTALLIVWRDFFWQHALIIGIAVTALVYTTSRTIENLRNIHKR